MSSLLWLLLGIAIVAAGILFFKIRAGTVPRKCPTAINITFVILEQNRCDGSFKGQVKVDVTFPAPPPPGKQSTVEVKIIDRTANNITASPGTKTLTFSQTESQNYIVEGKLIDGCSNGNVVIDASAMCGNSSINLARITTPAPTAIPSKAMKVHDRTHTVLSTGTPQFETTLKIEPCPAPGGGAITVNVTPIDNIVITEVNPNPVPAGAGATVVTIKGRRANPNDDGSFKTECVVGANTCLIGSTAVD